MRKSWPLGVFALLGVTPAGLAADPESTRPFACVPETELRAGNIGFADTSQTVSRKIGKPRETRTSQSEDDGGQYDVQRWIYDGIEIDLGRNSHPERIIVTKASYRLPSGVHVGMSQRDVARRLRFSLSGLRPGEEILLNVCDSLTDPEPELSELRLRFKTPPAASGEVTLEQIEIGKYGP